MSPQLEHVRRHGARRPDRSGQKTPGQSAPATGGESRLAIVVRLSSAPRHRPPRSCLAAVGGVFSLSWCLHPEDSRIRVRPSRRAHAPAFSSRGTRSRPGHSPVDGERGTWWTCVSSCINLFAWPSSSRRGACDEGDGDDAQRRQRLRPRRERGAGAGELQGVLRDRERRAGPRDRHRVQRPAAHGRQEVAARPRDTRRRRRHPPAHAPERQRPQPAALQQRWVPGERTPRLDRAAIRPRKVRRCLFSRIELHAQWRTLSP